MNTCSSSTDGVYTDKFFFDNEQQALCLCINRRGKIPITGRVLAQMCPEKQTKTLYIYKPGDSLADPKSSKSALMNCATASGVACML
jgi:hypothetical protein